MNPETGKLEPLTEDHATKALEARFRTLLRPDGTPVPSHWAIFTQGELVAIKDHTFRVAHMNESCLVLEPVKPEDALKGVPAK